jgi:hypothetical protein
LARLRPVGKIAQLLRSESSQKVDIITECFPRVKTVIQFLKIYPCRAPQKVFR